MNNRVNCGKPEMAIRSQASSKCDEGSETRLHDLTGFYVNLSVESKGYESPRAPDNQAVQEVCQMEGIFGILRKKPFKMVQAMPARKIALEVSKRQGKNPGSPCGISQREYFENQALSERLV